MKLTIQSIHDLDYARKEAAPLLELDGGSWNLQPRGQQAHYDMEEGNTYKIQLEISDNDEKQGKLNVVNRSMGIRAKFQYIYFVN